MADVVVIGGGLAGAATAVHLARAGQSVTVLERDRDPTHKVCGEFLGRAACRELEALGIDLGALGAQWIDQVRLFSGSRSAQAPLPFRAAGLSRITLDPELRAVAERAGADVRLGVRSKSIGEGTVTLDGGEILSARAIVVATGKHEMRGLARRITPRTKDAKLGLKEHLRLDPGVLADLDSTIELHFFKGGYAGLMPIGNGAANLSIAIEPAEWRAADLTLATYRDWLQRTVPSLQHRLDGAQPLFAKPLAVSAVPYGFRLWQAPPDRPGLWRVGDQAVVTPSLTGEGMSLALGTARCLGDCLRDGGSQAQYRRILRRYFGRQIAIARGFEAVLDGRQMQQGIVGFLGMMPRSLQLAARMTRSA